MRKWLRRLGIAVVLMAVASATALYSYGRFAEAAEATRELVAESMLRLLGNQPEFQDRRHFIAVAALKMRSVLIDHLRSQQSERRGVVAVVLVGVARAGYCDERHRRHVDEHRQRPRQIQVLVFLLEIERGSHAVLRRSSGMVGRQSLAAPFQRSSVGSSASI